MPPDIPMHDMPPGSDRLRQLLAHQGISRGFLADAPIGRLVQDGTPGITLGVRLTSYRALPLSCIAGIEITLDGEKLDLSGASLGLAGLFHPLSALPARSTTTWFILDIATLFVPHAAPLSPGTHRVVGTLSTVEPYITAGRFTFHNSDARELDTADATP